MRRNNQGNFNKFWTYVVIVLMISTFVGGANSTRPTTPPPEIQLTGGKTNESINTIETAQKLIAYSKRAFAKVQDYQATLIKQERVKGKLLPNQIISMSVRHKPFSVYMKWNAPSNLKGQEVAYIQGRNKGKMRVRPVGLLRALGWVSLDPEDSRAKKHTNHSVTEAGLANLLNRFQHSYALQARYKKIEVKIGQYTFNNRKVVRIETIHKAKILGVQDNYRNVLYLDQETWLPTRVERYDWPQRGGDSNGVLLEVYNYLNVKTNVNLPASTFNK